MKRKEAIHYLSPKNKLANLDEKLNTMWPEYKELDRKLKLNKIEKTRKCEIGRQLYYLTIQKIGVLLEIERAS